MIKSSGSLAVFAVLFFLAGGCAPHQYPGVLIAPFSFSRSSIHMNHNSVTAAPLPDYSDFLPSNGSTSISREASDWEFLVSSQVFQVLPGGFIVGVSGTWFLDYGSKYGEQVLQRSWYNWWDPVPYDEMILQRTPTIGGYVGKLFLADGGYGGLLVQYGISIGGYKIKHRRFTGVDVYGGRNYSVLKDETLLDSGTSIRQTVEFGLTEVLRMGFWWESDGRSASVGGISFSLTIAYPAAEDRWKCSDYLGYGDYQNPDKREEVEWHEKNCHN